MALGLCRACASLQLAVVLIGVLVVVLGWATFVESRYGAAAARFGIYGTWWFAALGALLALNILCAALVRFPWKKRQQTGFLVTHAGLLVLLLGCLVSRRGGTDATLPVFEGHAAWRAYKTSQHFQLAVLPAERSHAETITVPFVSGPFNWDDYRKLCWFPWRLSRRDRGVVYNHGGIKLEVLDYYADSKKVPAPRIELQVAANPGSSRGRGLPDDRWTAVALNVESSTDPHAAGRRFGIGTRRSLPHGPRIVFWMTGSRAETAAFCDSRPAGPLGKKGRIVLHAAGKRFELAVDELKQGARQPLCDTGLEVEFDGFEPRFLGVKLRIHPPGNPPQPMVLFADLPEFNRQDYLDGVFGSFWYDAASKLGDDDSDSPGAKMLREAVRPRIDILQGTDRRLYYRTWHSPAACTVASLPADGTEVIAFEGTPAATALYVEDFIPMDKPGTRLLPAAYRKDEDAPMKRRQAKLRLTVDGNSKEFWLEGLPAGSQGIPPTDQWKVVRGKNRRVAVTMPLDKIDLGFRVYLQKFNRKLDPGTSQASHYSSLVDLIDRHDKNKRLQTDVLIALNAPVDFSDPSTGCSYRLFQSSFAGPWKPGDPVFHEMVDEDDMRDRLFLSRFTVNYDPGRGLKYAGSLLIVAGIVVMFYMRREPFSRRVH